MGCSSSNDASSAPAQKPQQQQVPPQFQQPRPGQVIVEAPNPRDPPFMKTAAPGGVSWGQYVRTGQSFVDPNTGFLAGPWAECISWGVIFEHTNDWSRIPEYAANGPVGGILQALETTMSGNPNKNQVMQAAQRLEDASHELANHGKPLPCIQQVATLPANAVPGKPCNIMNPQNPNTYMTVHCPPNAQPGQQIMIPAPVQPSQGGQMVASRPGGMSTGAKLATGAAVAVGGAVVIGGVAAGAYALSGGDLGGLATGAAGAVGGFAGDAAGHLGEFAGDAGGAIGDVAGEAGDWAGGAFASAGEWGADAVHTVGDGFMDLF